VQETIAQAAAERDSIGGHQIRAAAGTEAADADASVASSSSADVELTSLPPNVVRSPANVRCRRQQLACQHEVRPTTARSTLF